MSKYFIERPIFAWVIAIMIMLVGVLAVLKLPVSQYPEIAPPTITVNAVYPGADAQTVENSVTQVIEQKMTGLDGMMYMSSSSSSQGSASVEITFESGTDPDTAQVQVQNKLQAATASLPEAVQQQGLTVSKSSSSFLMVVGFISEDGSMDKTDIADYLNSNVVDQISRVNGVGNVNVFGSSYAMRIWLDPEKLRSYSLMPSDITAAISAQNAQVSAGQLAAAPSDEDMQVINATVTVQSYLQTAEEFGRILIKTDSSGAQVRLNDVARVEMGSENYGFNTFYNGKPAAGLGIMLASGSNALEVRQAVQDRLDQLSASYPKGLTTVVPYDTTPFIRLSISQVVKTLIEAIALVFLVMFLFLQSWRATIIPTLAVPVVILGTFAVLYVAGFSINILTMFALVLAIGLLVDDAIVVVENVERILEENPNISVKDATIQSMGEISKVLIGIALILSAVFVPMAFMGGSTGVIYRQFAITLITAMTLSAVVALIYTPALCVTILKRQAHKDIDHQTGFFGWFNRMFRSASLRYERFVGKSFNFRGLFGLAYVGVIVVLGLLFTRLPSSFVPEEDQGMLFTIVQTPVGSTTKDTQAVLDDVSAYFNTQEADNVESIFTITGFSFMGQGQNMGMAFIRLKDWDERTTAGSDAGSMAGKAMGYFMTAYNKANVYTLAPPSIQGLGNASGFDFQLQDTGGVGHEALLEARNMVLGMAAQTPDMLSGVRPNGQEDSPQLKVNVNHEQALAHGLSVGDINRTISMAWGSAKIGDFIDRGRIKSVYIQGDANARATPEDIGKWYVRNGSGNMVGFDAFATSEWKYGSPTLTRYNSLPSMSIQGAPAAGKSNGDAVAAMEQIASQLPDGVGFEWTGLTLQEKQSGSQAPMLYAISILVVFLCLAALYESWSIPFSVMLVVPLGVLGAIIFTWLRGFDNDVYLQVGLLTVIGLSAKNAILIIEVAKELQEKGVAFKNAVMQAARQRLRPIIMTSLAFGIGVVPLAIATGAGSGSQNAVGTSVLGGVIAATFLGVFFIPMFYIWMRSLFPHKYTNADSATLNKI
ncbi:MAG: efflux RND transporter permease subunit [Moraxella sp.]|uniref:efflux RND transporter permease subunit n=1 Tax=Moraxella sp. TaxID=479 RepID=UPI0026DB8C9F|nr:efflux RND transporter permease subunit [Moraxella sp.]MDO4451146.1 efflux RND transporter permease subunit [Moraxella sp.]